MEKEMRGLLQECLDIMREYNVMARLGDVDGVQYLFEKNMDLRQRIRDVIENV